METISPAITTPAPRPMDGAGLPPLVGRAGSVAAAPAKVWPNDSITLSDRKEDDGHRRAAEKRGTLAGSLRAKAVATTDLSAMELRELDELRRLDREVRNHEEAHLSAAGHYASGAPSYSFRTGPDGKRYATGGEVAIDVAREATPQATLRKMETVAHAALAPLHPSVADRRVAARAAVLAAQAKNEIRAEQAESSRLFDKRKNENATSESPAASSPASAETSNSRLLMIKAYRSQAV